MAEPNDGMLLVSLCNPATEAEATLLAVDPASSWAVTPLIVTCGFGTTGICRIGDDLFVASQNPQSIVFVLDARTLALRVKAPVPDAKDLHSLAAWNGGVAVASSGTDEVLWYRFDGARFVDRTVLWAPGAPGSDTQHVNGLAAAGERLVCCGFGPRFREYGWSESQDGFVYDVVNGRYVLRGLARPHSVLFIGDRIFVCESSRRNFRSVGAPIATLTGYTRGAVALDDGRVVVGCSIARERSRSTGALVEPQTEPRYTGSCDLHVIDLDGTVHARISLAGYGREVYDVFRLD